MGYGLENSKSVCSFVVSINKLLKPMCEIQVRPEQSISEIIDILKNSLGNHIGLYDFFEYDIFSDAATITFGGRYLLDDLVSSKVINDKIIEGIVNCISNFKKANYDVERDSMTSNYIIFSFNFEEIDYLPILKDLVKGFISVQCNITLT